MSITLGPNGNIVYIVYTCVLPLCIGVLGKVSSSVLNFDFQLKNLDPFLLLDEFKGGKPAGFPDHPHRGFETVSSPCFMLDLLQS